MQSSKDHAPEPDDLQLADQVARYQAGDDGAFAEIYESQQAFLRSYVSRTLGRPLADWVEPEDVAQETWIAAHRRLLVLEYRGIAAFRSWLMQLAYRQITTLYKYHTARRRNPGRRLSMSPIEAEQDAASCEQFLAAPDAWGRTLDRMALRELFELAVESLRPADAAVVREVCEVETSGALDAPQGASGGAKRMRKVRALRRAKAFIVDLVEDPFE